MKEDPDFGALSDNRRTVPDSSFLKLFTAGVIGWLLGTVLLFAISWWIAKPVSVPAALVWTISHGWASFLFGVLVLVGYGLASGFSPGRAAWAYILPVALLAGIASLCLLVYPDYSMREDLLTYLPMVLMFYGMALLWMWMRKGSADAFARAVLPATLGGLVILAFVTVPVFASDAFRYRNTFEFTISKTEMRDGKFVAEGIIEIREPGRYEFVAPRYIWAPNSDGSEVEAGAIVWGSAGAPKADAPGAFPLQITWSRALQATEGYDLYDDTINVEVHDPDQGNKTIYFLSAPLAPPTR